jgi:hypothetical protein
VSGAGFHHGAGGGDRAVLLEVSGEGRSISVARHVPLQAPFWSGAQHEDLGDLYWPRAPIRECGTPAGP